MSEFKKYDYIITGAGCAGLSLLVHMIRSQKFTDKKILVVDKDPKTKNDRTWCFWERNEGLFESIVYKGWDYAWFKSKKFQQRMELKPYQYKLIRGSDFYNSCLALIRQQTNIEMRFQTVETVNTDNEGAYVIVNGQRINADYIFNSIIFEQPVLKKNEYLLLQHFKGWVINSNKEVFNPEEAVLMDFSIPQKHGTSFVYVMPFTPYQALVEYTVFSKQLLTDDQYEDGIRNYLNDLGVNDYTVLEKENGVIPMTNFNFPVHDKQVINIGTAGGQTKASSGYTFQFIQKHSAEIVKKLIAGETPIVKRDNARHRFYDAVLLKILAEERLPGDKIFTTLFQKNKIGDVFRFLDNETSLGDDLRIISTLPTLPFLKAAIGL